MMASEGKSEDHKSEHTVASQQNQSWFSYLVNLFRRSPPNSKEPQLQSRCEFSPTSTLAAQDANTPTTHTGPVIHSYIPKSRFSGGKPGLRARQYNEGRVKKPVIYIFSPEDREVVVALSLDPTSRFSAIYPIVPIKKHETLGESLEWKVTTHAKDGSMTEMNTSLDVSYLFWESEPRTHSIPSSPPTTPDINKLNDENAVVLAVDHITLYLDKTLQALGLHPEARTSFITFWLPTFLEHTHIALRFIPQSDMEHRAPLHITPKPDVVTRVFMVFKGVSSETLVGGWSASQLRGEKDVSWWVGEVGVDREKALDTGLYRVLEWGGMEGV